MTHHGICRIVLCAAGVLAAGSLNAAAPNPEHTGTDTVMLSVALGLEQTGAPAPKMDAACKDKFGKYLGEKVTTEYKINTQTLIMSATSTFKAVPTPLFPMGIAGSFSFMSDGIPKPLADLGVMRIIFSLDSNFKNPVSKLMFPLGVEKYNCVLASSPLSAGDGAVLAKAASHK